MSPYSSRQVLNIDERQAFTAIDLARSLSTTTIMIIGRCLELTGYLNPLIDHKSCHVWQNSLFFVSVVLAG
jgi:hypothetical protein